MAKENLNVQSEVKQKKAPVNKAKLGPDYVAPDGGWGWFVAVAGGISNLSVFAVFQQFGLLFRETMMEMNISGSQITTLINAHSAVTYGVGLANGPLFRRFTFRQVGFCGGLLVSLALFFTSISKSFAMYLITFSVLYGAGTGVTTSANALALNTYFKEKRRIATGIAWTLTGLGPVVFPQLINFLMSKFDVHGAVMIFAGIALLAVVASLLYQPAMKHSKNKAEVDTEKSLVEAKDDRLKKMDQIVCHYCQTHNKKPASIFSSQYLYNVDDSEKPGYEIIDPGTPMLALANDGWYSGSGLRSLYGSKLSLTSQRRDLDSRKASNQNLVMSNRPSYVNLENLDKKRDTKSIKNFKIEEHDHEDCPSQKAPQDLSETEKVLSNRPSYANLENLDKKRDTKSIKNFKIEEHDHEDCPSQKAPQDLSETEKVLIPPKAFKLEFKPLLKPDYDPNNNQSTPSELKYLNDNHSRRSLNRHGSISDKKRSNTFNLEKETLRAASKKLQEFIDDENYASSKTCTCDEERLLFLKAKDKEEELEKEYQQFLEDQIEERQFTCWEKFVIFFDLDLLKDFTFINLMIGITIANFAELNFSLLTPFVLGDFGYTKGETALLMSLLASFDIVFRFFVPFIAGKIGLQNKTFFLVGVAGMACGRIVLAHFRSYIVVLITFCWIGIGKGLRTVFMALVIPSHVPLDRLPGATGIHLLFSGFFYLVMGPLVGKIKDSSNYMVTLHALNVTTFLTVISWTLEDVIRKRIAAKKAKALAEAGDEN